MSLRKLLLEFQDDEDLKDLSRIDRENIVYKQLVDNADNKFQKIASGSARAVYKFKDNKVVKVAYNAKGIAQNEVECQFGQEAFIQDVVTKVFYCAENFSFIISEEARKARASDFTSIEDVNWNHFADFIMTWGDYLQGKADGEALDQYDVDQENEFVYDMTNFIANYNLGNIIGDFTRISSYGVVTRDGQEQIVLVDYGLTREVYDKHYS